MARLDTLDDVSNSELTLLCKLLGGEICVRESVLCAWSIERKLEWGDRMDWTGESEARESLWWSLIDEPVDFRC